MSRNLVSARTTHRANFSTCLTSQAQVCLVHPPLEQRSGDHGVNEAKEAELYQVLFRNLTTRHGRRNKTPRSALTASTSLMTFLKRSLGGQKVFVFSSIPPGNALHITVGRFIFKNIKSRPQGTCEIFYSPFRVHDPARARLWNSRRRRNRRRIRPQL